jgi:hypothetical protein
MGIKIAVIGDLHFGIAATEREAKELDAFLGFIKTHDLDIIQFNGDYYDHKLSLGEPAAIAGMKFFSDVLNVAAEKGIKIRMIEGTQSHDRFQPRIFNEFIPDGPDGKPLIDYRLYETVGAEEIDGLNILFVPEEYPMNIDEYYAPYKEGRYDLMFVHGTWDFINFGKTIDNDRNDMHTAPVFKYGEWKDALEHGLCVSGHIHGRHGFKDKGGTKIIYPGSFTAWSFDQISERGFIYIDFDPETKKFEYELINNDASPKYANLDIKDLGSDLASADVNDIKARIEEQSKKVDFIKVSLDGLSDEKLMIIKELYKGNPTIKVEVPQKEMSMLTESADKRFLKYDYLLNDTLPVDQAVQRFIKEEFGKDLALDVIDANLDIQIKAKKEGDDGSESAE